MECHVSHQKPIYTLLKGPLFHVLHSQMYLRKQKLLISAQILLIPVKSFQLRLFIELHYKKHFKTLEKIFRKLTESHLPPFALRISELGWIPTIIAIRAPFFSAYRSAASFACLNALRWPTWTRSQHPLTKNLNSSSLKVINVNKPRKKLLYKNSSSAKRIN